MLCGTFFMYQIRITPRTVFLLQLQEIDRKILHFLRERRRCDLHIKADRQPVIMTRWKNKTPGMREPFVHLDVPGSDISVGIFRRQIFHFSLSAMVNDKHISARHIFGIKIFHMKIIEAQHRARKHFIAGHRAVAGVVAELIHTASVAFRQQNASCLPEPFFIHASSSFSPSINILSHASCINSLSCDTTSTIFPAFARFRTISQTSFIWR